MNTGGLQEMRRRTMRVIALALILACGISLGFSDAGVSHAGTNKKVKSITIQGYRFFTPGKTSKLKAKVKPANASNKNVTWKSSNPKIAKVDKKGRVKGIKPGTVTITAKAKDGSGVKKTTKVIIFKFSRSDVKWAGHRGMRDNTPEGKKVKENTAAAFRLAGEYGLWGCDCDLYETKHTAKGNFKIVINHDATFLRVHGVNKKVRDMTAGQIMETKKLKTVCFLNEYLEICREYGMVPLMEIKDPDMSKAAVRNIIDTLVKTGGYTRPDDFYLFSTHPDKLIYARKYCVKQYGFKPLTMYELNKKSKDKLKNLDYFRKNGFSGLCLNKNLMTARIDKYCQKHNMRVVLWAYWNDVKDYSKAYQQLMKSKFKIDVMIIEQMMFE